MPVNEEQLPAFPETPSLDISGNYQPIHLEDTVGAIFLGIFAVISLIGWMRSEARYQRSVNRANANREIL